MSELILEVAGLRKEYAAGNLAIERLDLSVTSGELVTIVGPSGCGKTTLLRTLSGLVEPTAGDVKVHGKSIRGEPPTDVAVVFQDYSRSLLPWLTVRHNVELPLRYRGLAKRERAAAATEALASVGLVGAADRHPWQLSGGMQQRVCIARALACRPALLLMDEPFASVDAHTRIDLEDLLLRVWQDSGISVVFITHDIDESIYLGDRVVVLNPSPTSVRLVVDTALPRPRDQLKTKELPEFARLRGRVLSEMRAGLDHSASLLPA
jgi:NitT/TauT family transport system ATP-binding protein